MPRVPIESACSFKRQFWNFKVMGDAGRQWYVPQECFWSATYHSSGRTSKAFLVDFLQKIRPLSTIPMFVKVFDLS